MTKNRFMADAIKNIAKINPKFKPKDGDRYLVKYLGELDELKMLKDLECDVSYNSATREINLYKKGVTDSILKSFNIDDIIDTKTQKGGMFKGKDKVEITFKAFMLKLELLEISGLEFQALLQTWDNMESSLVSTIVDTVDMVTNAKVASNIANIGMNIANSAIGAIKKDEKDKQ